jgi:hypothetical protein
VAWSKLPIEDSNLTVQIAAIRRVLNGEPGGKQWIQTLPCRGYRFVGPPPTALQDVTADFDFTFDNAGVQQLKNTTRQVQVDRSHVTPTRMIFILMDTMATEAFRCRSSRPPMNVYSRQWMQAKTASSLWTR